MQDFTAVNALCSSFVTSHVIFNYTYYTLNLLPIILLLPLTFSLLHSLVINVNTVAQSGLTDYVINSYCLLEHITPLKYTCLVTGC